MLYSLLITAGYYQLWHSQLAGTVSTDAELYCSTAQIPLDLNVRAARTAVVPVPWRASHPDGESGKVTINQGDGYSLC
jgi:hypothetical protein